MSPLPWGDIPPGPGFVKIPRESLARGGTTQVRGLPDNYHTGGTVGSLYHPVGNPDEIWKPLDSGAHPHDVEKGDTRRWATQEWRAIEVMRHAPKPVVNGRFTPQWPYGAQMAARRETGDGGRQWLVMPRYEDYDRNGISEGPDNILALEQTLRWFNSKGWTAGDDLTVMLDGWMRQHVFVDLSCASFYNVTSGCYAADDFDRWIAWLKWAGWGDMASLRRAGRAKLQHDWLMRPERANRTRGDSYPQHVYVSFCRPFSLMWADRRDGDNDLSNMWVEHVGPPYQTFIGTREPLSDDYLRRYQLTWSYSPIQYEIGTDEVRT